MQLGLASRSVGLGDKALANIRINELMTAFPTINTSVVGVLLIAKYIYSGYVVYTIYRLRSSV